MHIRIVFATTLILLAVFMFCYGDSVKGVLVSPVIVTDELVGEKLNRTASLADRSRKAGGVINYTAVGDSITVGVGASTPANSYVERLAQFIESDTGMTVTVDNRGVNGMTSAQLLTALQTDAAMRASLQNAQVITVNIGSNDFATARASYRNLTCGVIDGEDCLRATVAQLKSNWNLIVAEILALRANAGVSIRAFDLYSPTVQIDLSSDSFPGDGGLNDFQVLRPYLDEANMHIRTVSLSNGIALGRAHRSFNGTDGGADPGSNFGLVAFDGFHPEDRGHSVIADRLRSTSPICLPPPQNGPRAFYRGEGNANDTTANNNHGTLENGTSFTAGEIGQAFSFDGIDDSVLVPQINLGLNYTIEMWIKPAPTQSVPFVHLAANDQFAGQFGSLGLFTDTPGTPGSYSFRYVESSTTVSTGQVIQPGRWSHVALTRASGVTRLYVDGILLATGGTLGGYNNQLRLGHSIGASTAFYTGAMDEVSLFDRALSTAEIVGIVDADGAGRCGAISNLQISPSSVTVNAGIPQTFTATGGTTPYTFSVQSAPPQHGTINAFSGVYTVSTAGVDTVRVTDASLFGSNSTVTVVVGGDIPCPSGKKVWDGGGTTNNWSDAANWCDNSLPNSGSSVVFDASSIKNATVDVAVTARAIDVAAAYTGTISVNNGVNLTFSGSGGVTSSLAGGTITNGNGTITFTFTFLMSGGFFNTGGGTINFDRDLRQTGGLFNDPPVANTGNVNFSEFSDLVLNGGIFNAPQGNLSFSRSFTFTSGTFNHNNGTVVFVGTGGSFIGIQASEIVFNNLTVNKSNEGFAGIFPSNRIARVIGTLSLSQGKLSGDINSAFRPENVLNISSTFGAGSTANNGGILLIENGPAGRSISIPAGVILPNLFVNDPGVTINAINPGVIQMRQLKMQRGVVSFGSTNVTAGIGVATCIDQTGGSISIGSGNFLCHGSVLLSQPDDANPSTFTAGSGNFTLDTPGRVFQISGGTFNAPTGTTTLDTGEFINNFTQTGGTFNGNGQFDCLCAQFELSGGTFNATSGTSTFRRIFKRTTGTFNPNGGTVVLTSSPGGSMVGPTITTFHNLTVAYTGSNHNLFATTTGTLILQTGFVDGGSLNAQGDVVISSGYGGGNTVVTLSGSAIQTFTNNGGVPPAGNWTIDKSGGKVVLATDMNLSNASTTFGLTNGIIETNANLLDLGARSVLGGGASSYVIGNLRRSFPGGGQDITRRYDLGATAGYAPVTVRVPITPGPTSATLTPLTVSTVNTPHPLFNPAGSLSFYWKISEGVGLQSTDVTFTYPQAAVNGNEANYRLDRIENGSIQILNNTILISTNTVTLTGINNFAAEWTMSELPPPLVLSCPSTSANPGGMVNCSASGGRPPYQFSLAVNNSGASISPASTSVTYTAGPTTGVTDTLRLTDNLNTTVDALITVVDAFTVVNTNDSGAGSLRQAIINSNNAPGTQTITFAIPGPPPYTIISGSPRRFDITDTVIIDGFSPFLTQTVEVRNAQFNLFASNSTIKGLIINSVNGGISDHAGIYIGATASGNIIRGNFIGIGADGLTPRPNGVGIEIHGDGNMIGGHNAVDRNVISGNATFGILVESLGSPASGNVIQNNSIGVNPNETVNVGNGQDGIRLHSAQGTIIGGDTSLLYNTIAANQGAGIATQSFGSIPTFGNRIRGNRMRGNNGLGIDLSPNGVSPNDPCDADTGDNRRQNFPELTLVSTFGGNTLIQGTLNAEPGKTYDLDFYRNFNFQADESGFGEGFAYIGSSQVTTPATCGAPIPFSVTLPGGLLTTELITATATDPDGSTSEFSQFRGIVPVDITGTILDSNNLPMKGVGVTLRIANTGQLIRRGVTDKVGRFKFANVSPGQDYEVKPLLKNYIFVPATRTYPQVIASQDDAYTALVNSFSIGGRITMNGFSLPNVDVTLSGATSATTHTISNGTYSFDNLPSGTYTVSVSKHNVIFNPSTASFPTPITSNQTANFDGVSILTTVPGRILYTDVDQNIVAMNPDGSGVTTLFPVNSTFTNFQTPRASRDGTQMVFTNGFHAPDGVGNGRQVRVGAFDGSGRGPSLSGSCSQPTLSPDRTKVACVEMVTGAVSQTTGMSPFYYFLHLLSTGGGSDVTITAQNQDFNQKPDWKPDGSVIGFAKNNGIWTIGPTPPYTQTSILAESNNTTNYIRSPRWSSDGTRLLFTRPFSGADRVASINADGTNLQNLVTEGNESPVWSPDDSRIAYVRATSFPFSVVTRLADGTDPITIVSNFGQLNYIDWAPDNNVATPQGLNTHVNSGRVEITFPSTSGANKVTTITPIDPSSAGTTPGGFVVGDFAYEIHTTANFTPPVEVCISLHHLIEPSMAQFNAYRFMHSENGVLVDRTSRHDFFNRLVCGSLTSFSPVALMKLVDPTLPTISGLVVDENGEPMDDVAVSISDNEIPVKTNHLGQFEFANLKPNTNYSVQIFKSGYLFSPPFQNFLDLTTDETVVFTATAASFDIGGVTVDGDGTPIPGVTVKLSGAREAEVVTGADGAFSFPDLPANAEYKVMPLPNGVGVFSPRETSVDALQSDLTGLIFQQFAPTAANVTVSGRVLTEKGAGIAMARLVLTSQDGTTQTALTNPFGYFRFDQVEVGQTYILEVGHKRYRFDSSPRVLMVQDELNDVDFTGSPPG